MISLMLLKAAMIANFGSVISHPILDIEPIIQWFKESMMNSFEEYAVVKLKRNISSANLKIGDRGTIVMIHTKPYRAYKVEFLDKAGNTIALLTLKEEDLKKA